MISAQRATEIRRLNVGDAELHVEISGQGRPVLLVAGLGGRGEFWKNQAADFSNEFRVITFDHRGCGNSTSDRLVRSTKDMAKDVITILDELKLDQVSLVGHSTGGAIGQNIALEYPERLHSLVISCSWAGPDPYFTELFRVRRKILETCGPAEYLSAGTFLAMPGRLLQQQMRLDRNLLDERLAAFPGREVELSRIDAIQAHDRRDDLHKIATKTLCIGAIDDQITPAGFTEELATKIPGAEKSLLDRGGHFCPIAATDPYNARILKFLRSKKIRR